MAATGYTVYFGSGFGSGGQNREDLLDLIVNVDPHDTPLLTKSPKTVAKHTLHEWLTDTLQATATGGSDEGADFSFSAANFTARTRVNNWTQIFRKDILVSQTMRAVDPAGVSDEYAYQVMKALKEIGRNIEATLFNPATTATASGAARVMKVLDDFITTNAFSASHTAIGGDGLTSATGIAENLFNGMLEEIFNDGGNPDSVYVGARYKRQISAFTTNTSVARNIALADKRLINVVDMYESDFGIIQIILDRWVPVGSTATASASSSAGRAFFLETPMVRIAFLRPIKHVPLPPNGDAARGIVLGELTLEVGNEKALGRMTHIRANV